MGASNDKPAETPPPLGGNADGSPKRLREYFTPDLRVFGFFRVHANDIYEPLDPGCQLGQKVVLYVHGWQPGHNATAFDTAMSDPADLGDDRPSVGNRKQFPTVAEGFVTPNKGYGENFDTTRSWREQGFDVIVFCWSLLADESTPFEAERKIWDEGGGANHLRWKCPGCKGCQGKSSFWLHPAKEQKLEDIYGSCEKGYRSEGVPNGSLGSAFSDTWDLLCHGQRPSYLHLVGHSLGSQLACCFLRKQLRSRGGEKVVNRFTLLDPYFTTFAKPWLEGRWTGEVVREVVGLVAKLGSPVEQYKSSMVLANPISDSNDELLMLTAYFIMEPTFLAVTFGAGDVEVLAERHSAAKYIYFRSKECAPPAEVTLSKSGAWEPVPGSGTGYSSASDDRIRDMMGGTYYWVQIGGTNSPDPSLHTYEKRTRPSSTRLPGLCPSSAPAFSPA